MRRTGKGEEITLPLHEDNMNEKLLALAAESTVMVELLAEDATLIGMIRSGKSHAECLVYINENY